MKEWGFTVLRFTNDEVLADAGSVANEMSKHIIANAIAWR